MGGADIDSPASPWSSPTAPRTQLTPSCRALLAAWSAAWDAPRFRWANGHRPGLDHHAVAPLLKLAASCVTELLPHLQNLDAPPLGASQQLLVEALDGESRAALTDPKNDPVRWIRRLTHATLQTGDGDYVTGLDATKLDQLIDEHCQKQLAEAQLLVESPTHALKSALASLTEATTYLLKHPAEEADLAILSRHWGLVRRLERLAEDAGALATEMQSDVKTESPEAAPTEVTSKVSEDDDSSTGEAAARRRTQRTKSQVMKSVQVEEAVHRIDERRGPVRELRKQLSVIEHDHKDDPITEETCLQETLQAVEQAYKRARHFGEDLVEEMLALDKLSNLAPEDRSTRKAAIAGIESLLDDVDSAKGRLSRLQKELQTQLDSVGKPGAATKDSRPPESKEAPSKGALTVVDVPLPDKNLWSEVPLQIHFASREELDRYVISASAPGLQAEQLKITYDSKTLSITGVRVPNEHEEAKLQHKLLHRLRLVEQDGSKLDRDLKSRCESGYAELGQGQFGRFTETFSLPQDADTEGIAASYENGDIRLTIAKRLIGRLPTRAPSVSSTFGGGLHDRNFGRWDDFGLRSGFDRFPAWEAPSSRASPFADFGLDGGFRR